MFRSGRLTNAGLFLLAPVAEVGPRVEAAYPDYLVRQGLLQVVSARELED